MSSSHLLGLSDKPNSTCASSQTGKGTEQKLLYSMASQSPLPTLPHPKDRTYLFFLIFARSQIQLKLKS